MAITTGIVESKNVIRNRKIMGFLMMKSKLSKVSNGLFMEIFQNLEWAMN